jgi:hypothetical protein
MSNIHETPFIKICESFQQKRELFEKLNGFGTKVGALKTLKWIYVVIKGLFKMEEKENKSFFSVTIFQRKKKFRMKILDKQLSGVE